MHAILTTLNQFANLIDPRLTRVRGFQRNSWVESQIDNGEEKWAQQRVVVLVERAIYEDALAELSMPWGRHLLSS